MADTEIRILVIDPDQPPTTPIVWVEQSGAHLRALVGGHVEPVYLGDAIAYVNEDGIAAGLKTNERATILARRFGAHPHDIPSGGLRGTVVFAGRNPINGAIMTVPTDITLAAVSPDLSESNDIPLPSDLMVPGGVYVSTQELMLTNMRAARAGCPITLPAYLFLILAPDGVTHIVTNTGGVRRTERGTAYLRCHLQIAVFVAEKEKAQPLEAWLDIPLIEYIRLPVPSKWDPTHSDYQPPESGRLTQGFITIGDLMGDES
jgi:hypothetical protein